MSEQNFTDEQAQLLKSTEQLLADPETRGSFFNLLKKKNPNMVIPEVDVPAQFQAALAQEREAREKLENQIKEDKTRAEVEKRRSKLHGKGLTDSDITEVEKLMTEKGIVSHDTAADFYLQSRRLAEGSTNEGSVKKPSLPNPMEEAKATHGGNIRAWARDTALKAMQGRKAA